MLSWTRRRWGAALIATILSGLALGIPTDIVPNPVFGRQIPAPMWSYLAWAVTSVLAGLVLATYVTNESRRAAGADDSGGSLAEGASSVNSREGTARPGQERRVTVGGLLSFLAIGCPTCNKIVIIALGSTGAVTWFEPVQPLLAVVGIGLLGYALHRRLAGERSCPVPADRLVTAQGAGAGLPGRDRE